MEQLQARTFFNDELLNPEYELFKQSLRCFGYVKKLPPELRVMIWKDCFPTGTMALKLRAKKDFCSRPNPITLFINQESRLETLHHFQVLFSKNPRF
jgi:hypothetical protein